MKAILLALGLVLAGCFDNTAQRQHIEMVRAACDNGQPSACIELQDAYAQQRQARADAMAYIRQMNQQSNATFSNMGRTY